MAVGDSELIERARRIGWIQRKDRIRLGRILSRETLRIDPELVDDVANHVRDARGRLVSRTWLETGTGEMFDDVRENVVAEGAPPPLVSPPQARISRSSEMIAVPIVEIIAGEGRKVKLQPIGYGEPMPASLIRQLYHVEPSRLCYFRARGSAMDGDPAWIPPGALLRGKTLTPGEAVEDGAVYFLHGPTGLQLKRLRFEEHTGERFIHLWSDNDTWGRDRLPLKTFQRDYTPVIAVLTAEKYL